MNGNPSISVVRLKITDLSADVLDGKIRLPKFQRDFVWTRQQVLDLLDSIARDYPIGSFPLWKSAVNLASETSIAGLTVETPDDGEETVYLLDGCQRLSTICGALHWEPDGDPQSFWNLIYDLARVSGDHGLLALGLGPG